MINTTNRGRWSLGSDVNKTTVLDDLDQDDDEQPQASGICTCTRLIESYYYRQFIRVVSLVNLIVLAVSLPWSFSTPYNNAVRIQFACITVIDFVIACIYTFSFVARFNYWWYSQGKYSSLTQRESRSYTSWFRMLISFGLTVTMWYSVGIGIYRTKAEMNEIPWQWYLGYIVRCILPVPPVMTLFLKDESSFFEKLKNLLKWRQLAMVTIFYFVFVSLLALMGVHLIGGLSHACVYKTKNEDGSYSISLAHPFTHCNPMATSTHYFCEPDDVNVTGLVCAQFPPQSNESGHSKLFFEYRNYVYYGQFSVILDALFAVYEASTLELWSFMMYSAIESHGAGIPVIFYVFLTFFIVIILQQSMFLVVIIESFADLRSHSFFRNEKSTIKTANKPKTVLSLKNGSLEFYSPEIPSSVQFLDKHSERLVKFEKVFLVLVVIDFIFISSKYTGMTESHQLVLQIWQVFASVMFVIELLLLFIFYVYHGQLKLFLCRPYYICLIVLAVGGMVAGIPVFYDPIKVGNFLAIFQSFRFPRLLRLYDPIQSFVLKIMGKNIPILSIITIAMIAWLTVVNAQIFGYKDGSSECDTENGFGYFFIAFQSTFQLVMNEAWTDVTSEVMCRSSYWFVTNFYFIVIHLFSSLIFLNFFGAVILDNLEYDEEKKKRKLEKIKKKEEKVAETIPTHLTIYKKLRTKPKLVRVPHRDISDWDPKLEELEVQKFFEAPSFTDDFSDETNSKTHANAAGYSIDEDGEVYIEPRIKDIDSILNYIQLWRQIHAREEEAKRHERAASRGHLHLFGQSLHSGRRHKIAPHENSEYIKFQERYPCFDKALFCMPRNHCLRKLCTWILKARAEPPSDIPSDETKGIFHITRKEITYFVRWIVSRMSYFTWLLFLGLVVIVFIQMRELSYTSDHTQHTYTIYTEAFYLLLMFSWLILKVISQGCFLNPHAAITSPWDVIDWILVLDSGILFALFPLWGEDYTWSWSEITVDIWRMPRWCYVMFAIRSLRSLHVISIYGSARSVVSEIVKGWRNLAKAIVIMLGFMFMFASLGVQLFSGTDPNPIAFCNDLSINVESDCIGQFQIEVEVSREFLPVNTSDFAPVSMMVPRVWYKMIRDFNFNNVFFAFVTLFELLTLEGWPEVRNLFEGRDEPVTRIVRYHTYFIYFTLYMAAYMHVFVFVAVNIGLQLFLGIVVNNFNEQKPGHTSLLSVDQNRWVELMQRISLERPYKIPKEPRHNEVRRWLYSVLTSSRFRYVPTIVTSLLAMTLVVPWNDTLIVHIEIVNSLIGVSILLNTYTMIEMSLKLLAFGPAFFRSWRNIFDFFLSFISFIYIITAMISLANPSLISHIRLSYFALALTVVKLLTVIVKYSAMLNLLRTVFSTVTSSLSLTLVLCVVLICYAHLGVVMFNNVRSGEAINYFLVNFKGTRSALSVLWRSLTGEDWYQIMWDAAVAEPYCSQDPSVNNCGNMIVSILYFCSFTFLVAFILINVFIGVLLEKFSIFYNDEETNLKRHIVKDFKNKWRLYDDKANGNISISKVKLFLRSLTAIESFYTYVNEEAGKKVRKPRNLLQDQFLLWEMEQELRVSYLGQASVNPETNNEQQLPPPTEIKVKFANVLRMLAYRCEDIHKRLEPQELRGRVELEQTIQMDVAQECIFKWMKKRVKPVYLKIKQHRQSLQEHAQVNRVQSLPEKRQRFRSLHRIQSQDLLTVGQWNFRSMASDDEDGEFTGEPLSHANSDEQIVCIGDDSYVSATESFRKLRSRQPSHSTSSLRSINDRVKDWYHTQETWMENLKTNDSYFDDGL